MQRDQRVLVRVLLASWDGQAHREPAGWLTAIENEGIQANAWRAWEIPCSQRRPCRWDAAAILDGRPTVRRNQRPKPATRSTQQLVDTCSRAKIGAKSAGIAPRLSARTWRPVQSSNSRYWSSVSDRKPRSEARRPVLDVSRCS